MSSGFMQDFIDVKKCGGNRRPVLNEREVLEILHRQVLMKGDEEIIFCTCESGSRIEDGGRFHLFNAN